MGSVSLEVCLQPVASPMSIHKCKVSMITNSKTYSGPSPKDISEKALPPWWCLTAVFQSVLNRPVRSR